MQLYFKFSVWLTRVSSTDVCEALYAFYRRICTDQFQSIDTFDFFVSFSLSLKLFIGENVLHSKAHTILIDDFRKFIFTAENMN